MTSHTFKRESLFSWFVTGLQYQPLHIQYLWSLYNASSQMLALGYGPIDPTLNQEVMYPVSMLAWVCMCVEAEYSSHAATSRIHVLWSIPKNTSWGIALMGCIISGTWPASSMLISQSLCWLQVMVVMISFMLSTFLFPILISIITTSLIARDSLREEHNRKLEVWNQYMAHRRLPIKMRDRIRSFLHYRWRTHRGINEASICPCHGCPKL